MTSLTTLFTAPALALALLSTTPAFADTQPAIAGTEVIVENLPEDKRTTPGLYVTAAEAADTLAAREEVLLIDVRSPEETMLVGYATATDANIPFAMIDSDLTFDPKKDAYKMSPDPAFADNVKTWLATPEAEGAIALLVMCRSGTRSAKAVDALAAAGVELPIYSVVDGFEGDKDGNGVRNVNGWKNAGAEWTYKVTSDLWPRNQ